MSMFCVYRSWSFRSWSVYQLVPFTGKLKWMGTFPTRLEAEAYADQQSKIYRESLAAAAAFMNTDPEGIK